MSVYDSEPFKEISSLRKQLVQCRQSFEIENTTLQAKLIEVQSQIMALRELNSINSSRFAHLLKALHWLEKHRHQLPDGHSILGWISNQRPMIEAGLKQTDEAFTTTTTKEAGERIRREWREATIKECLTVVEEEKKCWEPGDDGRSACINLEEALQALKEGGE